MVIYGCFWGHLGHFRSFYVISCHFGVEHSQVKTSFYPPFYHSFVTSLQNHPVNAPNPQESKHLARNASTVPTTTNALASTTCMGNTATNTTRVSPIQLIPRNQGFVKTGEFVPLRLILFSSALVRLDGLVILVRTNFTRPPLLVITSWFCRTVSSRGQKCPMYQIYG